MQVRRFKKNTTYGEYKNKLATSLKRTWNLTTKRTL